MEGAVRLSLEEARALTIAALRGSGASVDQATPTAEALVAAEAMGQPGHGLSRVSSYCSHLRCGKVDGAARPRLEEISASVVRVDAARGFAFPAIAMALAALPGRARTHALAAAAIVRSHHFGQAGLHALALAEAGLVGLVLGNTPKAMAFPGGRTARLGTNPIALAAPLPAGAPPLLIDLALSTVARGKIMAAGKAGRPIPEGWALDVEGRPTTDPEAALAGTMAPIGGAKGAALALIVEVLAAAVVGGAWGWQASSFLDDKGGPPEMGHLLIAFDPNALSQGLYEARMAALLEALAEDEDVRLPGVRAFAARARAAAEGLALAAPLAAEIRALSESRG